MSLTLTAEDRFGVLDLYSRYSWALDTASVDDYVACFHSDGVTAMGASYYRGADEIRAYGHELTGTESWAGSQHYNGQLFFLEGDSNRCQLKCYSMILLRERDGSCRFKHLGIYRDTCVRDGDRWVFLERLWEFWDPDKIADYRG